MIRSNLTSQGVKKSNVLKIGLFSQKIAIISITILASRIVRQPNDSPSPWISAIDLCPQIGGQPNSTVSTRGHQREKVRFGGKCLFMNNFSSIKARRIILTLSCSSRQAASIHMFFIIGRSILKLTFQIKIIGKKRTTTRWRHNVTSYSRKLRVFWLILWYISMTST